VHVLDASRGVPVASSLLGDNKDAFMESIKKEYDMMRERHLNKKQTKRYLAYEDALANKTKINWDNFEPTTPQFLGEKVLTDYPLADLVPYIDWTPFFRTWELHGKYPEIFNDPMVGEEASKLFQDAQKMLDKIVKEKWIQANGVVGFYPANAVDDGIVLFKDENRQEVNMTLNHLRQQNEKEPGQPNYSLADFIAPKTSGKPDYIGGFAVTTGIGIEGKINEFEADHDDYSSILLKALADRLAEAFAEKLHEMVRKEFWGYQKEESLDTEALIREKYVGIRPAPGYPACPDHTEKELLFKLLNVTQNTGITITESYAMFPTAAVSGWYFSHPESKYFGIGKIGKDQVQHYSERKGMTFAEVEKWLSPVLNYDA
jgi:5-methyltetrahydrofolate--homocysteine methyltransferase